MNTSWSTRVIAGCVVLWGGLAGAPARADNGVEAVLGAVLGAGSGALLGQAVAGRDGALVGGALGAAVGVGVASRPIHPVHAEWSPRGGYGAAPMYAPPPAYPVVRYTYAYPVPPQVVYRTRPYCEDDWRRMHGRGHTRIYRSVESWEGYGHRPYGHGPYGHGRW